MESMVIKLWRIFSNNVLSWIDKHGRETGYDMTMRNGEKFNLADILTHPVGWSHDLLKYALELYMEVSGLGRKRYCPKCGHQLRFGDFVDQAKVRKLCYKLAHVSQLAVDGSLSQALSDDEPEQTQDTDDIKPDPPRGDFYGPMEPLK